MVLNVGESWNTNKAGCVGIPRDDKGDWKGSFLICAMHTNNVTLIESWTVCRGLEWAWEKGVKIIDVRIDSREVFEWIRRGNLPRGPLNMVINECRNWRNKSWDIKINNVYKEQNIVADIMAKAATGRSIHQRDQAYGTPSGMWIEDALLDDKTGIPMSR